MFTKCERDDIAQLVIYLDHIGVGSIESMEYKLGVNTQRGGGGV